MYMDGEARGRMRAGVLYEDEEEVLLQSMLPRGRGFRERSSFTTTRRFSIFQLVDENDAERYTHEGLPLIGVGPRVAQGHAITSDARRSTLGRGTSIEVTCCRICCKTVDTA